MYLYPVAYSSPRDSFSLGEIHPFLFLSRYKWKFQLIFIHRILVSVNMLLYRHSNLSVYRLFSLISSNTTHRIYILCLAYRCSIQSKQDLCVSFITCFIRRARYDHRLIPCYGWTTARKISALYHTPRCLHIMHTDPFLSRFSRLPPHLTSPKPTNNLPPLSYSLHLPMSDCLIFSNASAFAPWPLAKVLPELSRRPHALWPWTG